MARILIADDNPARAGILRRMFERRGHEVTIAATADGALQALEESVPQAVFLKVRAVGDCGFEILDGMKRDPRLAKVPAIGILSRGTRAPRSSALSFDEYLRTPLDLREVI